MKILERHSRSGVLVVLAVLAVLAAMTGVIDHQIRLRMDEVLVRHGEGDPKFSDIDRIYSEVAAEGRAFGIRVGQRNLAAPDIEGWLLNELQEIRKRHPEVVAVVFACEKEERMLLARMTATDGMAIIHGGGYHRRGWYRDAILSGHAAWHEPFLGDFIKDPIAVFAVPFYAADGTPAGVACVDISLGFMGQSFVKRFQVVFLLVVLSGIGLIALIVVPYLLRFQRERMRLADERRQMGEDLAMAKAIQSAALPVGFPDHLGFRIFASMKAAREVGGDFYDFYPRPDGNMVFLVADVSGKGIPAALFMMRAKAVIRAAVFERPDSISTAIRIANDNLADHNEAEMFVTAWVGVYHVATGEVAYVNAGHNPPLVKRADGSVEWVRGRGGLPLAALPGVPYRSGRCKLAPGDSLFLYTDGVTEAVNSAETQYGEARLEARLRCAGKNLVTEIGADLAVFAEGAEQFDDITMLTLDIPREATT